MSLATKSHENMQLAEYCLENNFALNAGISRAYYSAFQHTKHYLIDRGVTKGNYVIKAQKWGFEFPFGSNQLAFEHCSIWGVTKAYMMQRRIGKGLKFRAIGEKLHEYRKTADYESDVLTDTTLQLCIKMAQTIITSLAGE